MDWLCIVVAGKQYFIDEHNNANAKHYQYSESLCLFKCGFHFKKKSSIGLPTNNKAIGILCSYFSANVKFNDFSRPKHIFVQFSIYVFQLNYIEILWMPSVMVLLLGNRPHFIRFFLNKPIKLNSFVLSVLILPHLEYLISNPCCLLAIEHCEWFQSPQILLRSNI